MYFCTVNGNSKVMICTLSSAHCIGEAILEETPVTIFQLTSVQVKLASGNPITPFRISKVSLNGTLGLAFQCIILEHMYPFTDRKAVRRP